MSREEPAMQGSTTDRTSTGYVAIHPLEPEDAAITAAMRAIVSSGKGARSRMQARHQSQPRHLTFIPSTYRSFDRMVQDHAVARISSSASIKSSRCSFATER